MLRDVDRTFLCPRDASPLGTIMSIAAELNLDKYCAEVAARAKQAAALLGLVDTEVKNRWLRRSAGLLRENGDEIERANARDLAAAPAYGLTDAQIDRLRLMPKRIEEIAAGLEQVAALPDPVGEIIRTTNRPN